MRSSPPGDRPPLLGTGAPRCRRAPHEHARTRPHANRTRRSLRSRPPRTGPNDRPPQLTGTSRRSRSRERLPEGSPPSARQGTGRRRSRRFSRGSNAGQVLAPLLRRHRGKTRGSAGPRYDRSATPASALLRTDGRNAHRLAVVRTRTPSYRGAFERSPTRSNLDNRLPVRSSSCPS